MKHSFLLSAFALLSSGWVFSQEAGEYAAAPSSSAEITQKPALEPVDAFAETQKVWKEKLHAHLTLLKERENWRRMSEVKARQLQGELAQNIQLVKEAEQELGRRRAALQSLRDTQKKVRQADEAKLKSFFERNRRNEEEIQALELRLAELAAQEEAPAVQVVEKPAPRAQAQPAVAAKSPPQAAKQKKGASPKVEAAVAEPSQTEAFLQELEKRAKALQREARELKEAQPSRVRP